MNPGGFVGSGTLDVLGASGTVDEDKVSYNAMVG
jgi:hypothetical protein